MAYETSRRDFLKVLGVLGGAAFAGCKTVSKENELEQLVSDAETFAEEHKKDLMLDVSEIRQAAQYALALEAKGKKAEATAMADIVHYGLQNGKGNLAICVNLYHDLNGNRAQKWEGNTQVTTQALAKDLAASDDKAVYFKAKEVLSLVANASESYSKLPNRQVRDYVVTEQGFKILHDAKSVGKLLEAGDFQEIDSGEAFTKETHAMLGKNDYRQGVYNKVMPAAVKLVITQGAEYQATKK